MGPAVANLPVENFPTPTLGGNVINGSGTYGYSSSSSPYYPTTTG
jgi:hypothetical protein